MMMPLRTVRCCRHVIRPKTWRNVSSTTTHGGGDEGAKGRWWGSGNVLRGGGRLEAFKFCLYCSSTLGEWRGIAMWWSAAIYMSPQPHPNQSLISLSRSRPNLKPTDDSPDHRVVHLQLPGKHELHREQISLYCLSGGGSTSARCGICRDQAEGGKREARRDAPGLQGKAREE